ncbi:MAG: 2-succinyl-6-hydroxy-2,4-cyclohexadiene-1-carboxylate synthase [Gammaproteobacteria bacterium]|nr:2-succinyl-6-hydroxy-2,4-cyclohexadiene-1-carboxylate synthase [Gammaproteobacteria bacterium]
MDADAAPLTPALLLHGFLGCGDDWRALQPALAPRPLWCPDLPGHGASPSLPTPSLSGCADWLARWLDRAELPRVHLLGYSLGGRIALTFAGRYPERLASLTLEAAHPGLLTPTERQQRQQQDKQWAERFSREPLTAVLADWYRQPLFADLNGGERQALVAERSQGDGAALAAMVSGCSLADQPDLRPIIAALPAPVHYLFGRLDLRFAAVAATLADAGLQLNLHPVSAAGHNCHRAQPVQVATLLNALWSDADAHY